MQCNSEGSYSSTSDTINDALKTLEDIIKDTGEHQTGKLLIGIDCNASNYFNETTNKYDMDTFKQQIDADQLIEYFFKLINDRPLIAYINDPLNPKDVKSYIKLIERFKDKSNVVISCRRMFGETEESYLNVKILRF